MSEDWCLVTEYHCNFLPVYNTDSNIDDAVEKCGKCAVRWLWNRFAFVHFKNADVCRKAHDKADGLKIRGRTIMVVYARKKTDQPPGGSQTQQVKGV